MSTISVDFIDAILNSSTIHYTDICILKCCSKTINGLINERFDHFINTSLLAIPMLLRLIHRRNITKADFDDFMKKKDVSEHNRNIINYMNRLIASGSIIFNTYNRFLAMKYLFNIKYEDSFKLLDKLMDFLDYVRQFFIQIFEIDTRPTSRIYVFTFFLQILCKITQYLYKYQQVFYFIDNTELELLETLLWMTKNIKNDLQFVDSDAIKNYFINVIEEGRINIASLIYSKKTNQYDLIFTENNNVYRILPNGKRKYINKNINRY